MNKIIYPTDVIAFEQDYYNIIPKTDETFINHILSKLPILFERITFKDLLISSFEKIIDYSGIIKNNILPILSDSEKDLFLKKINYDDNQKNIASFFMKYSLEMDLKTCFYCNIEFINTFQDLGEYHDILDFLHSGSEEELIKYISKSKGKIIYDYLQNNTINSTSSLLSIDKIGQETINKINALDLNIAKQKSHFTLDHFIPKGEFSYFGLSLYNLVPSCYSCNSKFKKSKQYEIDDYLKFISPTSSHYSLLNNLEFKLYFNVSGVDLNEKINNVVDLNDFIIKPEINSAIDGRSKKFLDIFKIRGRYRFHKYQSMKMVKNRQEYSDSSIDEFSRITGKSITEIKKDIFGSIIYSNLESNEPLAKYKLDIAKQIGIFP